MKKLILFVLLGAAVPAWSQLYPLQEYEILAIETLPEKINLDMSLAQIEATKEASRLGLIKKRLNKIVLAQMTQILANKDFSKSFNLLETVQQLSLQNIFKELNTFQTTTDVSPVDIAFIVAPRQIKKWNNNQDVFYPTLYSSQKGSVFNEPSVEHSAAVSYEAALNRRMADGAAHLFQRQYATTKNESAFLAGAIVFIHAEGPRSWTRVQLLAGLPVAQNFPFEQKNDQVHLKQILLPVSPFQGLVTWADYPIATLTLENRPADQALSLKVNFGSFGSLDRDRWTIGSARPDDSVVVSYWSFLSSYNVPKICGDLKMALNPAAGGWLSSLAPWVNSLVEGYFDLQLNLHEITVDLQKLEISDVKLSIDLPWKGTDNTWMTIHSAEPETQFKSEGNKVIQENKQKLQEILNLGLTVVNNAEAQKQVLGILTQMLEARGVEVPRD